MMVKLFRRVRGLVSQELEMANRQNDEFFHSAHEGYGVLVEETNEAWDESIDVDKAVDSLFAAIRKDDRAGLVKATKDIERHATLAACEYIQVAAMARKLRDSERANRHEQNN